VTVLQKVDPSPTNIVMAGVLHMSKQGKVYVSLLLFPYSPIPLFPPSSLCLSGNGAALDDRRGIPACLPTDR
jgi:hypothetical protein